MEKDVLCLFFVADVKGKDGIVGGYMPLQRQAGFIPAGQPWIIGLDKTEYQIGDPLVITGVNFPREIAQINFVPVNGGVTVVRNITIKSGTNAELDEIPNLNPSVAYVVSIHFEDSNASSNEYPIVIK
jgi:hypothetical protein